MKSGYKWEMNELTVDTSGDRFASILVYEAEHWDGVELSREQAAQLAGQLLMFVAGIDHFDTPTTFHVEVLSAHDDEGVKVGRVSRGRVVDVMGGE